MVASSASVGEKKLRKTVLPHFSHYTRFGGVSS
jgi:hypothetical protein